MNALFVPKGHTVTSMEHRSADNRYMEMHEVQNKDVNYEHGGYQVRVHFNGEKTLMQCILNLVERRIGV